MAEHEGRRRAKRTSRMATNDASMGMIKWLESEKRIVRLDVWLASVAMDCRVGAISHTEENVHCLAQRSSLAARGHDPRNRHIRLSDAGAQAICEAPKSGITFDRKSFAVDPRVAQLRWVRA